jgi:NO-binding membrane sensor protein with MHYT domain
MGFVPGEIRVYGHRFGRKSGASDQRGVNRLGSTDFGTKLWSDHRRLFAAMLACKGDFLMTYDHTPEIAALAAEFGCQPKPVAMKKTHHGKMTELLIGRDLVWFKFASAL